MGYATLYSKQARLHRPPFCIQNIAKEGEAETKNATVVEWMSMGSSETFYNTFLYIFTIWQIHQQFSKIYDLWDKLIGLFLKPN